MLQVYAEMIDAISTHFGHDLQNSDLKFPKTRNNYKTGSSGMIDECTIPISKELAMKMLSSGTKMSENGNGLSLQSDSVAAVATQVEPSTPPVPPRMGGWLTKEGHSMISSWKKRYFVLKDGALGYFSDETLAKQHGNIALSNATVEIADVKGTKRLIVTTAAGVLYKMEHKGSGPDDTILHVWMENLERHIAYASTMALLKEGDRSQSNGGERGSFFRRLSSRGSFTKPIDA